MVDRTDIRGLVRTLQKLSGKPVFIDCHWSVIASGRTIYHGYGDPDACARALYGLCRAMAIATNGICVD